MHIRTKFISNCILGVIIVALFVLSARNTQVISEVIYPKVFFIHIVTPLLIFLMYIAFKYKSKIKNGIQKEIRVLLLLSILISFLKVNEYLKYFNTLLESVSYLTPKDALVATTTAGIDLFTSIIGIAGIYIYLYIVYNRNSLENNKIISK